MKFMFSWKTALFSLAACGLLLTTSCKKDDEDKTPSVEKMLTGKQWQLTALTVNPPIDLFGTPVTDWYAQLLPCYKDDLTIFNANGTVTEDQAANRCDDEPQTKTGQWSLSLDKKVITVVEDGEALSYNIIELNSTTFKASYEFEDDDTGITYTFTGTYTKK